jgi:hypothetical protein
MILILGVLIALTPCGICSAAVSTSSAPKACCMNHMQGGCCHSQKQEPYCKAMDQSSIVSAVQATVFAQPLVTALAVKTLISFQLYVVPSTVVSSSPPRGTLALRI